MIEVSLRFLINHILLFVSQDLFRLNQSNKVCDSFEYKNHINIKKKAKKRI